jgi:hypothetical protein
MTTVASLQPTHLDFKNNGTTTARLTASDSVFTLSGPASAPVKLSGVAEPVASSDAATKNYVDSASQGVYWHQPVRRATTANVTLASVINGSSVDGSAVSTGDRILVSFQTVGSQNGIYVIQASSAPVRADDMAVGSATASEAVFVESGTLYGDTSFVCTNNSGSDVVGTDSLNFVIFARAGDLTAGAGLGKTGADLFVNVDNSTIEINSDALRVKDAGITNAKLANSSVTVTAGAALSGGGSVALGSSVNLDVAVDDSSIEVNADALRVKALGITDAMLAGSISNAKLANSSVTVTAGAALSGGGSVALGSSVNLDVAVDGSSIEVNLDTLRVKALGITDAMLAGSISNAKLANSSVTVTAGAALTGGGAVALGSSVNLDVAVDGSSIEVNADALRVKALGITDAMLAGSISNAKLANSSVTVTAGSGLASGGAVSLGGSVSLTVDSSVVRTTGAQTVGGAKTFSSATVVSDVTASTSYTTGCLTLAGGLGVTGKVYANNEMFATAFNATSDATLKCDIAPISGALDTISRITPVEYRFNFFENDTLHYGVLAQELEENGLGDIVRHGENGKLAVEYNSLTGLLLAAVKELRAQMKESRCAGCR